MKIILKNINHYFLTTGKNDKRKNHILDEFKEYNLIEVNPVLDIGKNKSGSTGFSRIIDIALRKQDRTKPFTPFIIYEDDCSKYRDFPADIDIPDDTDFIYLGLSKCSMNAYTNHQRLYYQHYNADIVRVFNMLSTHGMLICSALGAVAIQKAITESYHKNLCWDIPISQLQWHYNVYAFKQPLVYQDSLYGGCESETRFAIEKNTDSPIPESYINLTNYSNITCTST
tara:strand:- start:446 stop:1129 length:684 start_codon:yes stop_codon:yes gene_type:complete